MSRIVVVRAVMVIRSLQSWMVGLASGGQGVHLVGCGGVVRSVPGVSHFPGFILPVPSAPGSAGAGGDTRSVKNNSSSSSSGW